jgi:hypothetical protein
MHRMLAAAALAALASTARADDSSTWAFDFSHLQVQASILGTSVGPPTQNGVISGFFTGTDRNHDGALTASELTSFQVLGHQMFPLVPYGGDPLHDRGDQWSVIEAFLFDPASGQLVFDVAYGEMPMGFGVSLVTGRGGFYNERNGSYLEEWAWTPQTQLSVRPIPEPATQALLVLGLLGVGLAARTASPAHRIASASPAAT